MTDEVTRKTLHILWALALAALLLLVPFAHLVLIQLTVFGLFLSILMRFYEVPFLSPLLRALEREDERSVPGKPVLMATAAALLASTLFTNYVAAMGMVVLAIADSTAHIVGRKTNYLPIPWDKTRHVEGRLAGILTGFVALLAFVAPLAALLSVTTAMFVESLPLRKVYLDDNLVVPIIAALVLSI